MRSYSPNSFILALADPIHYFFLKGTFLKDIEILVLYSSKQGSTKALADIICEGIENTPGCLSRLRTVSPISNDFKMSQLPDDGPPYVESKDLRECSGLILGSPTRFGNMCAEMKYFIDSTLENWISGDLVGKPAGFFTSSSSMHGGQETTLITMMIPLIHHGMIVVGIPYTNKELTTTKSGGTPYGASHVSNNSTDKTLITEEERILAEVLGQRVSSIAKKLN